MPKVLQLAADERLAGQLVAGHPYLEEKVVHACRYVLLCIILLCFAALQGTRLARCCSWQLMKFILADGCGVHEAV